MKKAFMTELMTKSESMTESESKTKSGYLMKSGFTIAELIVVMAIIAIIGGISVTVFVKQKNIQSVKTQAEQLKSLIMEAHADAMSPADTEANVVSVNVKIDVSKRFTSTYQPSTRQIHTYTFPSDASITLVNFNFNASDTATLGQISGCATKLITVASSVKTYTVNIDCLTGNVTIN